MKYLLIAVLICFCGLLITPVKAQGELIEHELTVQLLPADHQIRVSDRITLAPTFPRRSVFSLHSGLMPHAPDKAVKIRRLSANAGSIRSQYELELPAGLSRFNIEYSGQIYHPLEAYGKEQARGFRYTPGLVGEEGVYLAAGSYWYPQFAGQTRLRFTLDTGLPKGWQAVSQGMRTILSANNGNTTTRWHSPIPQEEIFLIAAPFTEYSRQSGNVIAQVFLRTPDAKLANKYLDATVHYLTLYETLLGPYPYGKFALVENFWETGFGMPSFTLLGSKVIRLPFILHSSYPHEILHNWFGNGVFVDYESGNWSEGLTAYLADHLIREQQGQGAAYRQQSLQKYRDYAARNRDFPLREFTGRHSSASEAVGYGKTLMLMHMLRLDLGEDLFIQALQQFYQQYQFKNASFDDLRTAFEQTSGKSYAEMFDQWVNKAGAPALKLTDNRVEQCDDAYCLHFGLQQTQVGAPYQLDIPVAVTLASDEVAQQSVISMQEKQQQYKIKVPGKPVRLDIDPEFDLFRHLALSESPPAFTELFGSRVMLVVLPDEANVAMKEAWQGFAADLAKMGPEQVSVKWDTELESLPEGQAVAVLGWENRFAGDITAAVAEYAEFQKEHLTIAGQLLPRHHYCYALTSRYKSLPRALIATDLPAALPGLGRKLPHYHKYSYLGFSGEAVENQLKGSWPVAESPMSALYTENTRRANLSKRRALISPP